MVAQEKLSEEPAEVVDEVGKGCFGSLLTFVFLSSIGVLGIAALIFLNEFTTG